MATLHLLCDFLIQRTTFCTGSKFLVIKKKTKKPNNQQTIHKTKQNNEAQLFLQLCSLHKPKNGNTPFKQQTVEQPY